MRNTLALAVLLAIALSPLPAETRWAAGEGLAPRVAVFLDFENTPSIPAVEAMKREAGLALDPAGARFFWLILNGDAPSETFDDLAVLRFRGSCRADAAKTGPNSDRVTLGSTEVAAHGVTSYGNVECDQLNSCLARELGAFCPGDRDEVFGRALGRVAAHELFHVLGRTTEHSHKGLSKALETPFDLIRKDFRFDRQAVLRLRRRLEPEGDPRIRALNPVGQTIGFRRLPGAE